MADYKDTYTVIIRTLTCWNNYPYHILGSSSPRNLSINFALHARRVKILFTMKQNPESLLLFSFSSPGIYIANTKSKGLFTQGC